MAKVAIVEDEAAIAEMYKDELKRAGYEVRLAPNGEEGFKLCESFRPDLVLLDWMMPLMNGQEMLDQLRQTVWGKKMLVIALTNLSQQEASVELGKQGFDDYAVKAYYTPKQLLEKVNELLKATKQPPKE